MHDWLLLLSYQTRPKKTVSISEPISQTILKPGAPFCFLLRPPLQAPCSVARRPKRRVFVFTSLRFPCHLLFHVEPFLVVFLFFRLFSFLSLFIVLLKAGLSFLLSFFHFAFHFFGYILCACFVHILQSLCSLPPGQFCRPVLSLAQVGAYYSFTPYRCILLLRYSNQFTSLIHILYSHYIKSSFLLLFIPIQLASLHCLHTTRLDTERATCPYSVAFCHSLVPRSYATHQDEVDSPPLFSRMGLCYRRATQEPRCRRHQ